MKTPRVQALVSTGSLRLYIKGPDPNAQGPTEVKAVLTLELGEWRVLSVVF